MKEGLSCKLSASDNEVKIAAMKWVKEKSRILHGMFGYVLFYDI